MTALSFFAGKPRSYRYVESEGSTCHLPRRRMRAFPGQSSWSIGHHGRV